VVVTAEKKTATSVSANVDLFMEFLPCYGVCV